MSKTVGILIFPGVQSLDVTGPMDVFCEANRFLSPEDRYQLDVIGLDHGNMACSNGLSLQAHRHYREALQAYDLLLVAGGPQLPFEEFGAHFDDWLRGAAARALRADAARHQDGEQRQEDEQVRFDHHPAARALDLGQGRDELRLLAPLFCPAQESQRGRNGTERDDDKERNLGVEPGIAHVERGALGACGQPQHACTTRSQRLVVRDDDDRRSEFDSHVVEDPVDVGRREELGTANRDGNEQDDQESHQGKLPTGQCPLDQSLGRALNHSKPPRVLSISRSA